MSTYLDAAGEVRDWINSLTGTLVGPGAPMPLGAALKQREGAATTAYGFLVELASTTWGGAEHSSMRASLSMQIYGATKESAADAATAYAEAVQQLVYGKRVTLDSGVTILGADGLTGPTWQPDGDEPRYIVEADFLLG